MPVSGWRVTYQALKEAHAPLIVVCGDYRFFLMPHKNPEVVAANGLRYALCPIIPGNYWVFQHGNDELRVTYNRHEETIDIQVSSPEPWDVPTKGVNQTQGSTTKSAKLLLL